MDDEKRNEEYEWLFNQMARKCDDVHRLVALLREMSVQHLHIQDYGRRLMASNCDAMISLLCEMDVIDEMLVELRD